MPRPQSQILEFWLGDLQLKKMPLPQSQIFEIWQLGQIFDFINLTGQNSGRTWEHGRILIQGGVTDTGSFKGGGVGMEVLKVPPSWVFTESSPGVGAEPFAIYVFFNAFGSIKGG